MKQHQTKNGESLISIAKKYYQSPQEGVFQIKKGNPTLTFLGHNQKQIKLSSYPQTAPFPIGRNLTLFIPEKRAELPPLLQSIRANKNTSTKPYSPSTPNKQALLKPTNYVKMHPNKNPQEQFKMTSCKTNLKISLDKDIQFHKGSLKGLKFALKSSLKLSITLQGKEGSLETKKLKGFSQTLKLFFEKNLDTIQKEVWNQITHTSLLTPKREGSQFSYTFHPKVQLPPLDFPLSSESKGGNLKLLLELQFTLKIEAETKKLLINLVRNFVVKKVGRRVVIGLIGVATTSIISGAMGSGVPLVGTTFGALVGGGATASIVLIDLYDLFQSKTQIKEQLATLSSQFQDKIYHHILILEHQGKELELSCKKLN